MLQVYKYIKLISEVIENVSFVAWLVKFWHYTMTHDVTFLRHVTSNKTRFLHIF